METAGPPKGAARPFAVGRGEAQSYLFSARNRVEEKEAGKMEQTGPVTCRFPAEGPALEELLRAILVRELGDGELPWAPRG